MAEPERAIGWRGDDLGTRLLFPMPETGLWTRLENDGIQVFGHRLRLPAFVGIWIRHQLCPGAAVFMTP